MNLKAILILFTLSVFALQAEVQGQGTKDSTLQEYIESALAVSPTLKSHAARTSAYNDRIAQVSALPDPRVALSMSNLPINSFSFTQEPMTSKVLSVSQTFPFPGKLSLRGEISAKDGSISQQTYFDVRNDIIRNVKKVYYEIAFLKTAIEIENESQELLRSFSKVVRSKYEVADGTQQDIIKSDLEISRTTDRILQLQEQLISKTGEMNSLLLRAAGKTIETDSLHPISDEMFTVIGLIGTAKEQRPFLAGISQAMAKAQSEVKLADMEWYPDFTISAGYAQRDYMSSNNNDLVDLLTFSAGINIPLNNGGKRDAAVEEAKAREEMYTQTYSSALQQLQTQFSNSLASLGTIRERTSLLTTGLLPQAGQALHASFAGYQVGTVDYLTVLDNLIKLYQLRTDYYRLRTDYWKTRADIDFYSGNKIGR